MITNEAQTTPVPSSARFETFFASYLGTTLWDSETPAPGQDEDEQAPLFPISTFSTQVDPGTLAHLRQDAGAWFQRNHTHWDDTADGSAGADYWYSRNRTAPFTDRARYYHGAAEIEETARAAGPLRLVLGEDLLVRLD